MAIPSADQTEIPLVWVALGGLASACAGAFTFLWSAISGTRKENNENAKGIWQRLTTLGDSEADRREQNAKVVATREDLAELRDELQDTIEKRAALTESRIADIVRYELSNPPHGPR